MIMNKSQEKSEMQVSIELPPVERLRLEKAAAQKNMTVSEYLLYLIQVSTHQAEL